MATLRLLDRRRIPHAIITAAALLAWTLAACADQPYAPSFEPRPDPITSPQTLEEVVPGEILVQMKDGISPDVLTGAAFRADA